MSILVLRHETWEHLGYFGPVLRRVGMSFKYWDLGETLGTFNGVRGLIVLGGPMSANDPVMGPELEAIRKGIETGIPMLGICLGSQLIAKALGGRVYRNDRLEIGWEPVDLTEAGLNDPVLGSISSPSWVFHWHSETFDLPKGAEWLARSERTRHQAFRYGSKIYGLQFHPEVTPEMIEDWCSRPVNCGDVSSLEKPIDARAVDQSSLASQILENWLSGSRIMVI